MDKIKRNNKKENVTVKKKAKTVKAKKGYLGTRIVILQRGWIYVGRYYRNGHECRLENASCIRRWGTTMGLGELAMKGPLSNTILEPCPQPVEFHRFTEVASLGVDESKWKL